MEEATFLTKFAPKVTVVHRREEFRASKIMLDRARHNPKIAWKLNAMIAEIQGGDRGVTGVILEDQGTGDKSAFATEGVFIAIGHSPNTAIFRGKLEMNDVGYLKVKYPSTQTSVEGVFAAGDVADPTYRQAVSAAGEGCKAAIDAERWLAEKDIKRKIFHSSPWVSARKYRETAVTHNSWRPQIGNGERRLACICAHHVIVCRAYELRVLQGVHPCFRKHPLREYHDGIVLKSRIARMPAHTLKRPPGFAVQSKPIGSTKLSPDMIAAMY